MLKEKATYSCPVSHCDGFVSYISYPQDKPFWGCGECGSVWYSSLTFLSEIKKITNRFHYRKHCYLWTSEEVLPNDLSNYVKNYREKVEKEPLDKIGRFVRD